MSETIETATAAGQAPTEIAQPPTATADAASPAPAAPREPKAATVALATFADLERKAIREDTNYTVNLPQEDGTTEARRLHLRAISGPEYDALIAKCPPTREQQSRQMAWNPDTFEPLLVSHVVVEPDGSPEMWAKLRKSPAWSGGEWASLAMRCQAICMQGLDVPFNVSG